MKNEKQNTLKLFSIEIGANGFRLLVSQKVDISNFDDGLIKVNGQSGSGKSTLKEMAKIGTQGSAARDKDYFPEGSENIDNKFGLCETLDQKRKFYIRVSGNKNAVKYSFLAEDENGTLVETKTPLGVKITPGEMHKQISTALTYGIADFLSENPTTVKNFIESVPDFYNQLKELGLLGKETDANWEKTFNCRIEKAIAARNVVQTTQSKLGAYKVNLDEDYDFDCPDRIDTDLLEADKLKAEEAKTKADDAIIDANTELNKTHSDAVLETAGALAVKRTAIQDKAAKILSKIESYNNNLDANFEIEKNKLSGAIRVNNQKAEDFETIQDKLTAIHGLIVQNDYKELINIKDLTKELAEDFPAPPDFRTYKTEVEALVAPVAIPTKTEDILAIDRTTIPTDQLENIDELHTRRKDYQAAEADKVDPVVELRGDLEGVSLENMQPLELELDKASKKVFDIQTKIDDAADTNLICDKFDAYHDHAEADAKVKKLYNEKNLAYLKVNTGVDGLKITTIGDEGKEKLVFSYNGEFDPEYFKNEKAAARLLTSYSEGQKHLIAAILQVHLMKSQKLPLNALWYDRLGTDAKLDKLFNDFAKEHGLTIFLPCTNDKTVGELDNEIVILNGELLF